MRCRAFPVPAPGFMYLSAGQLDTQEFVQMPCINKHVDVLILNTMDQLHGMSGTSSESEMS